MSKRTSTQTIDTTPEIIDTIEAVETETIEVTDTPEPVEQTETIVETEQVEQTVASVEDVVRLIVSNLNAGEMTMYIVAKALNATLTVFGVQKDGELYQVRPQMIYNYNKNKMVVKGEQVEKVTADQAVAFVTKFVEKRVK